jgi:hypothetical protein
LHAAEWCCPIFYFFFGKLFYRFSAGAGPKTSARTILVITSLAKGATNRINSPDVCKGEPQRSEDQQREAESKRRGTPSPATGFVRKKAPAAGPIGRQRLEPRASNDLLTCTMAAL